MSCTIDYTSLAVSGKVDSFKPGLTTPVTPTDRPKSVRNRCVIDVLVAILCCQLVVEFSVMGVSVKGLSQISFFVSTITRKSQRTLFCVFYVSVLTFFGHGRK